MLFHLVTSQMTISGWTASCLDITEVHLHSGDVSYQGCSHPGQCRAGPSDTNS